MNNFNFFGNNHTFEERVTYEVGRNNVVVSGCSVRNPFPHRFNGDFLKGNGDNILVTPHVSGVFDGVSTAGHSQASQAAKESMVEVLNSRSSTIPQDIHEVSEILQQLVTVADLKLRNYAKAATTFVGGGTYMEGGVGTYEEVAWKGDSRAYEVIIKEGEVYVYQLTVDQNMQNTSNPDNVAVNQLLGSFSNIDLEELTPALRLAAQKYAELANTEYSPMLTHFIGDGRPEKAKHAVIPKFDNSFTVYLSDGVTKLLSPKELGVLIWKANKEGIDPAQLIAQEAYSRASKPHFDRSEDRGILELPLHSYYHQGKNGIPAVPHDDITAVTKGYNAYKEAGLKNSEEASLPQVYCGVWQDDRFQTISGIPQNLREYAKKIDILINNININDPGELFHLRRMIENLERGLDIKSSELTIEDKRPISTNLLKFKIMFNDIKRELRGQAKVYKIGGNNVYELHNAQFESFRKEDGKKY